VETITTRLKMSIQAHLSHLGRRLGAFAARFAHGSEASAAA
jgi:hypothetical protein